MSRSLKVERIKHLLMCLECAWKEKEMKGISKDLEGMKKEIERLGVYGYLAVRYGRATGQRCMAVKGAKEKAPLYTDKFPRYPHGGMRLEAR